jgi:hypothetical protein
MGPINSATDACAAPTSAIRTTERSKKNQYRLA